ncbi:uncharacterized protein PHACADRAFT_129992 [Phanerochaete carnosa HHB-10118-sp]|uniref:L-lysine 6-oxidase n=1 Tax=Phanerochaete carnosa (strain HHB-10118-sp) TaxID=650164 RepID=K5VUY5_PHACS|nr:uncharacterized protein PHACADRAFT_129992 [Phanerochaete carnosa HHB-10118-sp]EKM50630.1 hypothetical protein PHACADRAFT_129992 [Phanerochaete carnosa HHB-10118-sp]
MTNSFAPTDPSKDKKSPTVDPTKIARVEIFPPIGIARVGDSGVRPDGSSDGEIEYYYAPEVPGITDPPADMFRDKKQRIRRQASSARPHRLFRVYAYDAGGAVLGEINNEQNYTLSWTVHVANKKAAYYEFSGEHTHDRLYRERKKTLRNPDTDPVGGTLSGDPFDKSLEGRARLIIDPGAKPLTRGSETEPVVLAGRFDGSNPAGSGVPVTLGELRTDAQGRLVFLGGTGLARSVQKTNEFYQPEIISEFDSIDWIDDICDGWVAVSVAHPDSPDLSKLTPLKATVCSAPPKFAWGIESPTSLYDILENFYKKKQSYEDHSGTDFYKDIWPVLAGTYGLSWVNEKAFQGHGPGGFGDFLPLEQTLSSSGSDSKPLREHVFERLREPDFRNKDQAHVQLMPRLSGDNGDALEPGTVPSTVTGEPITRFAALTELQYDRFQRWKDGNFTVGTKLGTIKVIEDYPIADQPVMLARAALEQTIGDPLYPGIETFWIAKLDPTWKVDPQNVRPPFRVDYDRCLPGFLSRGLALPWQSDFDLCNTHWWPSARPDNVLSIDTNVQQIIDGKTTNPKGVSALMGAQPRSRWTEGLRDTPEDTTTSFFPGSTDMIHKWKDLGFVAKLSLASAVTPVWVEVERNLPRGFLPSRNE